MTQLPEDVERKLRKLVNPEMYHQDAYYHAQTSQFRHWLIATKLAMEDELVDEDTIACVLNRMVYGHPSGSESYERQHSQEMLKEAMNYSSPSVVFMPKSGEQA